MRIWCIRPVRISASRRVIPSSCFSGRTMVCASFPPIGDSMTVSFSIPPSATARYVFEIYRAAKSADSSAAAPFVFAKTTTPLVCVSMRWTTKIVP